MFVPQLAKLIVFFEVNVASHPLWLFLALFFLLLIVSRFAPRLPPSAWPPLRAAAAGVTLACYGGLVIWYTRQETYADHAEPTMAAVGWLFKSGLPVYHAADAAERYSHVYGPLAFAIPGWGLAIFGASISMSKVVGAAAGFAALLLMHGVLRRTTDATRAFQLTALFAGLCLMFRHLTFWIRPDSFLALFAVVALAAATSRRPLWRVVGWGVAAGVMINLKVTGPVYAAPALALIVIRDGLRSAALSILIAVVTAAMPFLLFSNVSFTNYVHWVSVSAGNGLQFWILRRNLEWALFLLVPLTPVLVPAARPAGSLREITAMTMGVAAGAAAVIIAAAKPGAGSYHVLPFVPTVVYLIARRPLLANPVNPRFRHELRAGATAMVVTVALVATAEQLKLIESVDPTPYAEDVSTVAAANPGTRMEMAYNGGAERQSFVRPILVFRSNAYLLDAPAVQEFQMSGLPLPRATLDALATCAVGLWLVPKDGAFLQPLNNYPSTGYRVLLPDEFRAAFLEAYEHVADSRYYQLWRCRHAKPS